jgi:leucyl-tRNA synthetase
VPAHDERDFAFAKKYGLRILPVIEVPGETFDYDRWQPWYEDKARGRTVNSGKYDGLVHDAAVDAIAADLAFKGLGEKRITWRLRDWGISRQRYWGTPIPIVHCDACGAVPVPDDQLPVVLPEDCIPDGTGNPLNRREDFLRTTCPKCGATARRETDTMDTFVDSSWSFMRYTCPGAPAMVDARDDYWMPIDQYIGGISHAILHLLYARFWTKVMRDMGLVHYGEPFTRLLTQGMVLNHAYFRRTDKGGIDYVSPQDVDVQRDEGGRITGGVSKLDGGALEYGGLGTMSKSKLNGVDPQDMIDRYGADAARLFVMFASPPEQTIEWSDAGVEGAARFVRRLWSFAQSRVATAGPAGAGAAVAPPSGSGASPRPGSAGGEASAPEVRRDIHLALRQANYDYDRVQYNTVVSAGMKMLNALESLPPDAPGAREVLREGLSILLRVLYPVIPHTTWVLWRDLGYAATLGDLIDAPWPQPEEAALAQDEIELVLQVNGKVRGKLRVPATADRIAIEAAAHAAPEVAKHASNGPVKKIVVVPGRLVNVVV